jgi:dienelactone hydrolase
MASKQKTLARRPVRVIADSARYIVRVGPSNPTFFLRFDGEDKPRVVQVPSLAWHGSYQDADEICSRLREKGYTAAASDIFGRVMDYPALEAEREIQRAREAQFWGE